MCCVAGLQTARQVRQPADLETGNAPVQTILSISHTLERDRASTPLAQCTYLFAHYSSVLADFGGASVKSECELLLAVVQVSL